MQINNCEGLTFLTWDMFDSPDLPNSGYKFMEREPVLLLDRIVKRTRITLNIILGYTSKPYSDKLKLVRSNSHRVGKAVKIRCVGTKKRITLVQELVKEGVNRIGVSDKYVYFDTDDLKERAFYIWG
jgi:hypothetical protein|tara:strand:+ start:1315 stop:1695 length:381 start_codon:yes stop_codon:yes gene_type:complete